MSSKSTAEVYGAVLVPLALVAGLAFDGGGYSATAWGWSTLAPLGLVVLLLASGRARAPGPRAAAFLGLLAAFVAWTWLSIGWSRDVAESVLDGERGLVYLAAAAALVVIGRPLPLLAGVLGGAALAGADGLATRIFGGATYDVTSAAADAAHRLAGPIGYSNAFGAFAAIGAVIAVALAIQTRRLLVATPLLVLLPALYLTYSRGAWLAFAGGLFAAAALRARRRTALAVAFAVVALVAAGAAVYGGRAYRAFSSAGPTVKTSERERLLSASGSSRAQYWQAAWRDSRSRPLLGSGAGSFQRYWLAHRPAPLPVRDAHSLELETLAEVGPIGLALLVALLAVPLAAGVAARREPAAPAAFGGYGVFLLHSAQDWDWEVPAVTVAGLACAAALLLLAMRGERERIRGAGRAIASLACAGLAAVAVVALVGNRALAAASDALDGDQPAQAEHDARTAQRWAPWSGEPWRLRGEAQLEQGEVEAARASFRRGLDKDDRDWELWLDLGLASDGTARREALVRAARLNPLEPELRRLLAGE